jgi:hypothetical protein
MTLLMASRTRNSVEQVEVLIGCYQATRMPLECADAKDRLGCALKRFAKEKK